MPELPTSFLVGGCRAHSHLVEAPGTPSCSGAAPVVSTTLTRPPRGALDRLTRRPDAAVDLGVVRLRRDSRGLLQFGEGRGIVARLTVGPHVVVGRWG